MIKLSRKNKNDKQNRLENVLLATAIINLLAGLLELLNKLFK